jgi:sugar phosphate isomerase/epimerase
VAFPIGAVDCCFRPLAPPDAAVQAAALGFEHLDVTQQVGQPDVFSFDGTLALPVWDHGSGKARPGCSVGVLPDGPGLWDKTVAAFRANLPMRMEPWPGGVVHSVATVRAMLAAVPGLGLCLDLGHVAAWGEDPLELLDLADVVQVRQAAPGLPQLRVDDPAGVVDFAAVVRRLEAVDYTGRLSIEYFDFPDLGWPLDDPIGHAVGLLHHLRAL